MTKTDLSIPIALDWQHNNCSGSDAARKSAIKDWQHNNE